MKVTTLDAIREREQRNIPRESVDAYLRSPQRPDVEQQQRDGQRHQHRLRHQSEREQHADEAV